MHKAHGSFCPSAGVTVPLTPKPFWIMAPAFPCLECTVHNGPSLISKWLHKRSPHDEQIIVMDFVMSLLKFHRHWYLSAELDGKELKWESSICHPCGVLHSRKVRKAMVLEPNCATNYVRGVSSVSQDQPHNACGVWALRIHLHHAVVYARHSS